MGACQWEGRGRTPRKEERALSPEITERYSSVEDPYDFFSARVCSRKGSPHLIELRAAGTFLAPPHEDLPPVRPRRIGCAGNLGHKGSSPREVSSLAEIVGADGDLAKLTATVLLGR